MSVTARLNLPYIAPLQAQKQVTFNEAMAALDQLVQPAVRSRTTTTPPAAPAEGDAYIVAPSASGVWAGKDGSFACFLDGGWRFRAPTPGWLAFVTDTAELAVFYAGAWSMFATNGGAALARLGINATADLSNRLAVAAEASLFTHDGGSHRMKLNKAATAETASLVYQSNYSGRAELGLAGDDAFRVKVSPNGSTWYEALSIAQGSGVVSLPAGQLVFPAVSNPSTNPTTLDDYREGAWTPGLSFGGATAGIVYGSPTQGRYTRVGRTVFATGTVVITSKGTSTGAALFTGLPFAPANDGLVTSVSVGYANGLTGMTGSVIATLAANASRFTLYQSANGVPTPLTNVHFGNSVQIFLSVFFDV